ncbi:CPBP family intramembrane glutamic endopeptidase [Halorussus sp. MSC15.2]|uniref:CPBP family intramembrane glutamic endopeptidase n=1 Tax=Halorussus sp. MSC15.2 TaxID=2283638 RepID=UPI0013D42DC6|nr:CPBP family intramembrane glutamic endopeptidase [Halorussus sp. MSC15.2]NEU57162.1 CPBP family intramembrane metalloprotease [Halorussus sp. MSC15.2]
MSHSSARHGGPPDAAALEDRSLLAVGTAVAAMPVALAAFAVVGGLTGTKPSEFDVPTAFLLYGLANAVVLGGAYAVLSPAERRAAFPFRRPTGRELLAVAAAFVVGLGAYEATTAVTSAFGYEVGGLAYSLSDPATLAVVLAGPVLFGPWVEEMLYRGLLLGGLLARGWSPLAAAAGMILVFGAIHVPFFGVAGGVFVTVWSVFPTAFRLRYGDLTGASLLHVANNAFSYLVVVALGT